MVAGTRTVALQVVTNGQIPDSAGEGRGRGVGQDLLLWILSISLPCNWESKEPQRWIAFHGYQWLSFQLMALTSFICIFNFPIKLQGHLLYLGLVSVFRTSLPITSPYCQTTNGYHMLQHQRSPWSESKTHVVYLSQRYYDYRLGQIRLLQQRLEHKMC